jgi:outer membrane protein OmpA-like peptidoglycan-associated protein
MHASSTLALGAAIVFAAAFPGLIAPASAGPAYSADKIIDTFAPQQQTRSICLQNSGDCKKSSDAPTAAQARFNLLVNFEFNSDQLTAAAKENLDQFAKALRDPRLKGQKFEIDGHTDAVGAENYNLDLSDRRAASVSAYLSSQGIDPTLLRAKGFGKAKPLVSNPYSPENRRVETRRVAD